MLIDAHTHAWGGDTDELPWTDELVPPGWSGPYTHEELVRQDACCYVFPKADQLQYVADIAERYPDLSVVVDHMAYPGETTAPNQAPWNTFERVTEAENTSVKVSSLPRSAAEVSGTGSPAREPTPYPALHEYVQALLEWFGPERLLLGADYPWMDQWADYADCLRWVDRVEWLSARDAAWMRYRTFDRLHDVTR